MFLSIFTLSSFQFSCFNLPFKKNSLYFSMLSLSLLFSFFPFLFFLFPPIQPFFIQPFFSIYFLFTSFLIWPCLLFPIFSIFLTLVYLFLALTSQRLTFAEDRTLLFIFLGSEPTAKPNATVNSQRIYFHLRPTFMRFQRKSCDTVMRTEKENEQNVVRFFFFLYPICLSAILIVSAFTRSDSPFQRFFCSYLLSIHQRYLFFPFSRFFCVFYFISHHFCVLLLCYSLSSSLSFFINIFSRNFLIPFFLCRYIYS